MKLYSYWRSTTAYRVRIALHLKGLDFDLISVDLVKGEQTTSDYRQLNPVAGVPTLVLDDGTVLTQSMAILEFLDQQYAEQKLIPHDPIEAAKIRAAALVIATDIHPINNLKVGTKLKAMGHSQDAVVDWMRDWMERGFHAYEALLPPGDFSFGNQLTLADVCLIPQLYNAHRWGLDLKPFPRLTAIEERCLALPTFLAAHPDAQPDAN